MPSGSASRGCISHSGSGYWSTSAAMRRVWVPDRYWLTTRPVVSSTGYSSSTTSADSPVGHGVEAGLAVGVVELAAFEQARRARVADLGDRPEQAHLVLDALPGGAGVVGGAAGADARQSSSKISLGVRRRGSTRPCRGARRCRAGSPSRRRASPGGVTAALILMMRPSPLVEVPSSSSCSEPGQHDVGVLGGLGQEEVDDGVELELVERLAGEVRRRAPRRPG